MTATKAGFKQTEIGKSPESGMTGKWRRAQLAEICEHSAFGPRFSGKLYAPDGNVATLRTTDISEAGRIEYATMPLARLDLSKFQQHLLHEDDLVVTRTGRVGTTAVFDSFRLPVLPGAFLIRFRLNRELAEPDFYRYYFNSPEGHALIKSVATGSVQQNLNITSLHGLVIPVPPLIEQRAIAHILGTLDDKIKLNRQMNTTLEAIGRAIFKHWFIDFEFPNGEGKPYRSSGGEMVYNEEPEKEIPKEWKVGKLGEIVEFAYGKGLPETERKEGNFPVIGSNGVIGFHSDYLVAGPGIVIGRKGTLGEVFWVEENFFPIDTTFYVIDKLKSGGLDFDYFLLKGKDFLKSSSDSAVPGLNRNAAYSNDVIIPAIKTITEFNTLCYSLFKRKHNLQVQSHNLSKIRDSVLPKLMSGKIRVPIEPR